MIEFSLVNKRYGAQEILRDVSLRILPGERIGVVGPNGAGKSTLFALIAGEISPDQGTLRIQKGLRVGLVHQQLRAHAFDGSLLDFVTRARPDLDAVHERMQEISVALQDQGGKDNTSLLRELGELETQYQHEGGYTLRSRTEAALCGLGFPPDKLEASFKTFSGGWRMRAELARALLGEPDVLLLDEPSNYLDLPAVEWLQRRLDGFKGTLMLISHDRFLLRTIASVTVEIAAGMVTRYPCGFDDYVREREERYRIQEAAAKNQERRKERIERFVERFRAKNTKASQVQSRIKMLEKMETVRVPRLTTGAGYLRIAPPPHCGSQVVRLENAGHTYDGEHWVLRGVNLSINRGDKVALVGFNGMGKTTLLRILADAIPPAEGKRALGHKVVSGYQSQEFAETMPPEQSVYSIVHEANPTATEREVRTLLGGFGFHGDTILKPCDVLSGGEKIRLAFARLFIRSPNILLLDEPTTHLDIQGCQTLEKALRDYAGTVVFVSHDITFVRQVATRIVAMHPPDIQCYAGGYDYYRERTAANPECSRPVAKSSSQNERKERRRLRAEERAAYRRRTRELRKEVESIEKHIHESEAERDRLALEMSSGGNSDLAVLSRRVKELQDDIDVGTARWEKLAMDLEEIDSEWREAG